MRIIAFDLGRNMAWAYRLQNGDVMPGHIHLDGERAHRLGQLMQILPGILGQGKFDLIAYETPFVRGRDATRALWGTAGVIEACATNAHCAVLDVAVPTIKKHATGNGRAPKDDMISAARALYEYRGDNEHEADAVCLLGYAEQNSEWVRK